MHRPPGSSAPISAHGATTPGATLGAPQTIDSGWPAASVDLAHGEPVSVGVAGDRQHAADHDARERGRGRRICLDLEPAMVSRCASSSLPSGGSTSVRSQCSENFIALWL